MNIRFLGSALLMWIACNPATEKKGETMTTVSTNKVVSTEFQQIIDSANVIGSVLIYDPQKSTFYSNDFARCDSGFLPASTFKIPNSIIALETGIISNDSTIIKWDGKKRRLPVWEKDLSFHDAFHVSCVPCYQEIARKVGVQRMKYFMDTLKYGHMVFDTTTIDIFWLEGESKINQFEQIDFLQRFYNSELPIAEKTTSIMKRLMVIDENADYTLSGKTGWAIRNELNYGWFVGYFEKGNKVYYIATNIEPNTSFNMDLFPKIRNDISTKAFSALMHQ